MPHRDPNVARLLRVLIDICQVRGRALRHTARQACDDALRDTLEQAAMERETFAIQLREILRRLGGDSGSGLPGAGAAIEQGRMIYSFSLPMPLAAPPAGNPLGNCVLGEELAVRAYDQALMHPWPNSIRTVLAMQMGCIHALRRRLQKRAAGPAPGRRQDTRRRRAARSLGGDVRLPARH